LRLAPSSATISGGEDKVLGWRFLTGESGFGGALVKAEFRLGGQAWVGCQSSLRRGKGGLMGYAVHWTAGSISYGATTPGDGGHDLHDPRRPGISQGWRSRHPRLMFQGAHVAVAQRIEDELQLTPCRGHGADVAAAAVCDPFPQHPGQAASGQGLDGVNAR
jgi:hypothetical protein